MNRKQLITLIVVAVVLGALGYWAYQKQQNPYVESTRRMGDKLMPNFPLNDVAQITLRQASNELNLVKKDDVWTLRERGGYPANFNNIHDLLRKVWELKITKPVPTSESRLSVLELVPPDQGPSTLLEFKDANGKALGSLLLGAKHMREGRGDAPFGSGGGWPDGRYVMVGKDLQSVALVNETFSTAEAKPEDWLQKDPWFKIENLKSISVTTTNATNHWKLARESATNEWQLAELKPGEKMDSGKISSVTSAFSFPSFNDVVTNAAPEVTGLDKPAVVAKIENLDGFTYDLKVGGKSGDDNYYFQVAASAQIQAERAPGKDEKPEDKSKLDKEFSEKKSKLEDKLKIEKAWAKWTYVVSKWTIDPILKERKDLLEEQKEEKKDETKPSEPQPASPPPPLPKPAEFKTSDLLPPMPALAPTTNLLPSKPTIKPPSTPPPLPPTPQPPPPTPAPAKPAEAKPTAETPPAPPQAPEAPPAPSKPAEAKPPAPKPVEAKPPADAPPAPPSPPKPADAKPPEKP
jgi:hypothetical protein